MVDSSGITMIPSLLCFNLERKYRIYSMNVPYPFTSITPKTCSRHGDFDSNYSKCSYSYSYFNLHSY